MAFDNRRRLGANCSCGHRLVTIKNWSGPRPTGAVRCPKCEGLVGLDKFYLDHGTPRWPKNP
jgi:hypothetical protein